MMFKYQITVDLFSDSNATGLQESLNSIGENLKIFDNTWIVKSDFIPSEIKNNLDEVLSKKDYYTVLKVDNNSGFILFLSQDKLDWIRK